MLLAITHPVLRWVGKPVDTFMLPTCQRALVSQGYWPWAVTMNILRLFNPN